MAINQIWMHHFNTPLVPSVFDFGRNGKPPAIPALLDWLAVRASIRRLADEADPPPDPHQRLSIAWNPPPPVRVTPTSPATRPMSIYWRMNPKRMEAEAVRDNVLQVAGNLDQRVGGPDLDPETGFEIAAPQLVLSPRQGKARDVPPAVRFAQRPLMLPAKRQRDAAAGAGTGQQLALPRAGAAAGRQNWNEGLLANPASRTTRRLSSPRSSACWADCRPARKRRPAKTISRAGAKQFANLVAVWSRFPAARPPPSPPSADPAQRARGEPGPRAVQPQRFCHDPLMP